MVSIRSLGCALAALVACSPAARAPKPNVDPIREAPSQVVLPSDSATSKAGDQHGPVLSPARAFAQGLMPLDATGVNEFRRLYPNADGRGVLIAILDSGVDPTVLGLQKTPAGDRKILDLRDFSGEGRVRLSKIVPRGDTARVGGKALIGFGRVRVLNTSGPYYGGLLLERPLGEPPAADINGNGTNADSLPIVVTRATDGWVMFADTDGDGSLTNEEPIHDYLVAKETFGWHTGAHPSPIGVAANLSDSAGVPSLDLVFDNSGHGTHVAGIASAHGLYGVEGFEGVAPGAQLLGLKIANDANGGISVTGSMLGALDYALRFAQGRNLSLVVNLSFGIGNEQEGTARIDRLIDSVLEVHPDVVFVTSAGNDGPGLSTIGLPASAHRVITVGASEPGVFAAIEPGAPVPPDAIAFFSARGGELAKPDLVAPGFAYSSVPAWNQGEEVKTGTSMASPHLAGLAALLLSRSKVEKRPVRAEQVKRALMVTAAPFPGASYLDEGTGLANLPAAERWLAAPHQIEEVNVRAEGEVGVEAAFRPDGLRASDDTVQRFQLSRFGKAPEKFTLRSDAPWLHAPTTVVMSGSQGAVGVTYDASALREPGVYSGVVSGWGPDATAGPVFRLVNTVIVPEPGRAVPIRRTVPLPPGGSSRLFFYADSARPFQVRIAATQPNRRLFGFLTEPGGMPDRVSNGQPAGFGADAASYEVDGRDALRGLYQASVTASLAVGGVASIEIEHAPLRTAAKRTKSTVNLSLENLTRDTVSVEPGLALTGGERVMTVSARGGDAQRYAFRIPTWAKHMVVDLVLERDQWRGFTDFGLTILDDAGSILGKEALNYAFGRLSAELPARTSAYDADVLLLPAFADLASRQLWEGRISIRLYAGTPVPIAAPTTPQTIPPGDRSALEFPMIEIPWALPDGFFPLGIVVSDVKGHAWTREVPLAPPVGPIMRKSPE